MNGIAILALTLGIISVIVTLKYLKLYENLSKNLNKLSATCGKTVNTSSIVKIGEKLKLTDKELEEKIAANSDNIVKLLSANPLEKFSDYNSNMFDIPIVNHINIKDSIYIDSVARGLDNENLSPYIVSPTKPIEIPHSYEKEVEITKNHIDNLNDTIPILEQKQPKKDYVSTDTLKFNFIKSNWCLVNHEDRGYCFSVGDHTSCPGEIVNSRDSCEQ